MNVLHYPVLVFLLPVCHFLTVNQFRQHQFLGLRFQAVHVLHPRLYDKIGDTAYAKVVLVTPAGTICKICKKSLKSEQEETA